jgi:hypothetical protein
MLYSSDLVVLRTGGGGAPPPRYAILVKCLFLVHSLGFIMPGTGAARQALLADRPWPYLALVIGIGPSLLRCFSYASSVVPYITACCFLRPLRGLFNGF